MDLEFHPVANLFPLLEGDRFESFKIDIATVGLKVPIELLNGKILDGRNRYRACQATGTPLEQVTLPDDTDPIKHVISKNLERLHLNDSQRAMVAVRIANLKDGQRRFDNSRSPIGGAEVPSVSQREAATLLNVSKRAVQRASVVQRKAIPEIQEMVDRGEVSLNAAEVIALTASEEQAKAVQGGAKAVKKAVKNLRDKEQKKSRRKADARTGKKNVDSDEIPSLLDEATLLQAKWQSLGGWEKAVRAMENQDRWKLCETLEKLAREYRRLSLALRDVSKA